MATKAIGWAPANPWFEAGFKDVIHFMADDIRIKCLSLPYFLATKFTAFYDRGANDPRTSHDFEDIVFLLSYVSDWVEQIQTAHEGVRHYLIHSFADVLADSVKQEAILGNLFHEDQAFHYHKIVKNLKQICQTL